MDSRETTHAESSRSDTPEAKPDSVDLAGAVRNGFHDAAGKEAKSLSQRNEILMTLAKARCGAPTETESIPQSQ